MGDPVHRVPVEPNPAQSDGEEMMGHTLVCLGLSPRRPKRVGHIPTWSGFPSGGAALL